jgi:sulfite reductase (ferredoxin)
MKYLIANWGLERFKAKVEEYYGASLPEPHPVDVTNVDDHMGWHDQGDGKWFLGINVENGRVQDKGDVRLKSGLRALFETYRMPARLTALHGVILCDIDPGDRESIDGMLADYGIRQAHELSLLRRYSMACPALPTCGLAVTESERVLPGLIDGIEADLAKYGIAEDRITLHMTGCPNACARPYTPDIGLVGKARGKYTVFLGGNAQGTRLAFLYQDLVPLEEIRGLLAPVFAFYRAERTADETFGDFCHRQGAAAIAVFAEQEAA